MYCSTMSLNAQNAGIGITAPAAKLHIKGTHDTTQLVIDGFSNQTRPLIRVRSATGEDQLHIRSNSPYNTFYGLFAGASSDVSGGLGLSNTFIGSNSGFYNTDGQYNTAVGRASLYQNNSSRNTAIGFHTLFSNVTGMGNTAVGSEAMDFNQSGSYNTAIGFDAMRFTITNSANTAIGWAALRVNTADHNTAVGAGTLSRNTTGVYNTAIGRAALNSNETADHNTAVGYIALSFNNYGYENTAVGSRALQLNTACTGNTAVGFEALASQSYSPGGTFTFLSNNTAVGVSALKNTNPDGGSGGYANVAVGIAALYGNSNGYNNTAIGSQALSNNTTGFMNSAVGYNSGVSASTPGVVNTISIGNYNYHNAASNQAFLGNLNTAWTGGNVGWSTFSDARIKSNIQEDVKGLDFITRLRPVTYHRNTQAALTLTGNKDEIDYQGKDEIEKIKFSGFVAQEVEEAAKQSGYQFDGVVAPKNAQQIYSLCYASFVVPLVKAVQELNNKIDDLIKENNELKKLIPKK